MISNVSDQEWEARFDRWVEPFLDALQYKKRRQWAPVYLRGLIGDGDRKSIEPIAERLAPGQHDQINHFVNVARWDNRPLEIELAKKADQLVGGDDAYLIIDDTALVKKGKASVGVAPQYCGELGKRANCQALVSLTLARRETPVPVALRLYLPEAWAKDPERRGKCGVPEDLAFKKKGEIALEELGLLIEAGVRFGVVLADAGYGVSGDFRAGLRAMGLRYAVGVAANQGVYPPDVEVSAPERPPAAKGRPRRRGVASCAAVSAESFIADIASRPGLRAFRKVTWRGGTKGDLSGRFCAARVRAADGRTDRRGRHLPGAHEEWLVCEERAGGERRYYFCDLPARTSLLRLVQTVKARWSCEQAHEQMKNELGLDHYEGRSWLGLHHHALLCMIAMCFLQAQRLACCDKESGEKKSGAP